MNGMVILQLRLQTDYIGSLYIMAILVGQLIEILQRYDRDREVMIHTLKGAVLGFITLFIVPVAPLWAFSIGLLLVTTDRLIEVNKYNNERRRISQEA